MNGIMLLVLITRTFVTQDTASSEDAAPGQAVLVTDNPKLTAGDSEITTQNSQVTTNQNNESVSCGVAAAFLLLQRLGQAVPLEEIKVASPVPADGPMSFAEMQRLFENLGFSAEGFHMPLERVDRPVIAYRPGRRGKVGHFIVVEPVPSQNPADPDAQGDHTPPTSLLERGEWSSPATADGSPHGGEGSIGAFLVLNPVEPPLKLPAALLSKHWDGRVLVVYHKATTIPPPASAALRLRPWHILMPAAACILCLFLVLIVRRGSGVGVQGSAFSSQGSGVRNQGLHVEHHGDTSTDQPFDSSTSQHINASTSQRRVALKWSLLCVAPVVGVGYLAHATGLLPRIVPDRAVVSAQDGNGPVRIQVPQWNSTVVLTDGTRFEFGEVKGGEKLSHTFEFKNAGKVAVPVHELKMNCACNAQVEYVPLSPSPQPSPQRGEGVCLPGESYGIRVSTTAAGFGLQTKTIPFTISGSGSSETLFKLDLIYRVAWIQQVQFVPGRLDLGQLSYRATELSRELKLVLVGPPHEPEPELQEVTSDSPAISVHIERREIPEVNARTTKTIPAQRVFYWLQAAIDPRELALGQFHAHVTARTSLGEAKVHLKGEITRPVLAVPACLLVERSRAGVTVHRIRLRHVGDEPTEILSAESTTKGVSCELDSDASEVTVQVEPDAQLDTKPAVEIQVQAGDTTETVLVPLVLF